MVARLVLVACAGGGIGSGCSLRNFEGEGWWIGMGFNGVGLSW